MELTDGWEVAATASGSCSGPDELDGLIWSPARVPGTAAAAVGADGRDFDAEDWWFRHRFSTAPAADGERIRLELGGIATVSEVYLGGERILDSASMWESHVVDVTELLDDDNELVICCRALAPLLRVRRRPAARWRTRVVNDGNLRWHRTMVFGRSPGFAAGPAPVGPWRPVRLVRYRTPELKFLSLRASVEAGAGVLLLRAQVEGEAGDVQAVLGNRRVSLSPGSNGYVEGELRVPDVELWWPHTHGQPVLHELTVEIAGRPAATRQVGFRSLSWAPDILEEGLDLRVNGIPVFARGAVWTPADLISMAPSGTELRSLLVRVRDAGMNMLRVVGTGAYESPQFHDLCDELGILVWQDLMFANLDYPVQDPEFRAQIEHEARHVLQELAGRPSLAVVCGNSEVEQQAAMLGSDPQLGREDFWDHVLPRLAREVGVDGAYIRSTPCGGDLPFHVNRGIGHYFGVSGYFRGVEDARRASVRFAAECLAFANVPDEAEVPVHHPRWKAGVARDAGSGWDLGAGWDFDDVRDFYFGQLFERDPTQLRRAELDRYLDLSRVVSGEVMAEVLGEWRRADSPCRGALLLWLKDMLPGAGLGVLDHRGLPKVAYHYVRRALAPVAIWTTDEGVNGVAVHVANDRHQPLQVRLRVALYRDLETCVAEAGEDLELPPHHTACRTVEGLLGRFVDAAWAYRFGAAAQDAIVLGLESSSEPGQLLSQSVRFPAGRPVTREPQARLGIEAWSQLGEDGEAKLRIRSRRLAYGVRVELPGYETEDDAFSVEPGRERVLALRPVTENPAPAAGSLSALNLEAPVKIEVRRP